MNKGASAPAAAHAMRTRIIISATGIRVRVERKVLVKARLKRALRVAAMGWLTLVHQGCPGQRYWKASPL